MSDIIEELLDDGIIMLKSGLAILENAEMRKIIKHIITK